MNENIKKQLSRLSLYIAVVCTLFSFAVSVILVTDYYRINKAKPLTSPALIKLRDKLNDSPDDQDLKLQIRELDFIARKAHFTSEAKMNEGIILLSIGVVFSLIFIQLYFSLNKKFVKPAKKCPGMDDPFSNASKARILVSSAALWSFAIVVFLVLFFRNKDDLKIDDNDSRVSNLSPDVNEFLDNWPEFRGLNGASKTYNQTPPLKWDGLRGKGILWKSKIPIHGYSSPVVWKDKVFLTGGNKKDRKVFCFSSDDGSMLWDVDVPFMASEGSQLPEVSEDTGFAAPTMTTDSKNVFAIFATGDLIAIDMEGKVKWKKNLGIPDNHYAYSSSLLYCEGSVIVQYDDSTRTEIIAFDPETGRVVWKNDRNASISWASPLAVKINGKRNLLVATSTTISLIEPKTGKTLWNTECMEGEVASSPAFYNGMIFMANEYASAVGIDAVTGNVVWKKEDYDLPDVASPLASNGRLYFAASFGVLTCLDAKTGEKIYTKDFKNGFYSSPVLVGDLIYLLDMKGNMFIFKDADTYEEVAKNPLGELTVTIPAFSGKRIYLRGDKNLFCIDGK